VASSHDDTTEGAVHYFQDERGNWHSYTFTDKPAIGTATQTAVTGVHSADSMKKEPPYSVTSTAILEEYASVQRFMDPCDDMPQPSRSRSIEPRQSTSMSLIGVSNSTSGGTQGGLEIKTPSSSESWSSVSSSELAVDTMTNKLWAASYHRRNPHHHHHHHHHSRAAPSSLILGGHNSRSNHSQTGSGSPSPIPSVPSLVTITPEYNSTSVSASTSLNNNALSGRLPMPSYTSMQRSWQRNRRDVLQVLTGSLSRRQVPGVGAPGAYNIGNELEDRSGAALRNNRMAMYPTNHYLDKPTKWKKKKGPKHFYNLKLLPWCLPNFQVKVWFDRLNLMALFDRNRTFWENLFAILLAVGVACLGSFMLHQGYYQDLTVVILCFVMASCQFSLLKSVQPDAASPTHGFNRIVAFSRPIYFCMCGGLVYLLQTSLDNNVHDLGLTIYSLDLTQREILVGLRDTLLVVVLCFPILFSIGLFPQFNTFTMYLLEQIDMHMFGSNAASSLSAAFISLFRSWIAVGLLYGFAYGAMSEAQSTQHIMFSIFCGLLISVTYHLSRSASDSSVMWNVLKQFFCSEEDCFGETTASTSNHNNTVKGNKDTSATSPDELGDPLPKKLRETVNARLKSDAIICTVIGVVTFGLHSSTVFSALQPGLTPTLWICAIVFGFILHYLIPQFRKQLPCLLISHPILPPGEYNQFEVRDAARLMWFEKIFVWMSFFERNIIYPLLFISALTEHSAKLVAEERFGVAFGSLIIVITGMKALRSSFSDPGKHYLMLFFTILFFEFDWNGMSETFLVDFFFMTIAFHKMYELWLKLQFVITYIAPWQITWGSAFHAFAQPFSVPHSAMLFLQAVISSLLSAPLNPFLGSAIFITSYVRPIKFWEKDYNTKRVDHSNTRLSTHLEKNPGADDNNLNSIFYEHLTRSLQDSLCGDLILGKPVFSFYEVYHASSLLNSEQYCRDARKSWEKPHWNKCENATLWVSGCFYLV
jgi:hypothetical protein